MQVGKVVRVAAPIVIAIVIIVAVWAAFKQSFNPTAPNYYSDIAKISVSRLVSCGIGCPDLNNTALLSNYPKLKEALSQTDEKYFQKVSENDCQKNDCMKELFFNDTVDFVMPMERALRMSDDLLASGAEKGSLCFEGACHVVQFRVNREAVYNVQIDYRFGAFADSVLIPR